MDKLVLTQDCFQTYLPMAIREHNKKNIKKRLN